MIAITETETVFKLLKKFNYEKSKEIGFRTFDRSIFEKNLEKFE